MKLRLVTLLLFCLGSSPIQAQDSAGLTVVASAHDVTTTTDKLVTAIEGKGLGVFSRIDHAAGAEKAGMTLTPTELVLFGSPKIGTVLMHCGHTVAIDLPFKALIWQDPDGKVWLAYNDPGYLAKRHDLDGCEKPLEKVSGVLAGLAAAATQ